MYDLTKGLESKYRFGIAITSLLLIITIGVYLNNWSNPSNRFFFMTLFTAATITSTYSVVVCKDSFRDENTAFYFVFIIGFNLFVALISAAAALSNLFNDEQVIVESGIADNLLFIIKMSIVIEFLLDTAGWLRYYDHAKKEIAFLFISIELILFVFAIVPRLEIFSYDVIVLAGIMSFAHLIGALEGLESVPKEELTIGERLSQIFGDET